jgi:hypothetical protein
VYERERERERKRERENSSTCIENVDIVIDKTMTLPFTASKNHNLFKIKLYRNGRSEYKIQEEVFCEK